MKKITVVAALCVLVFGTLTYKSISDYLGEAAKAKAVELTAMPETGIDLDNIKIDAPNAADPVEETTATEEAEPHYYEELGERGNTLLEREDVYGIISIPDLDMLYPIMVAPDYDYFLHHDYNYGENSHGAIFKDPQDEEYRIMLFGHNMKDGSMFGSLKKINSSCDIILYTKKDVNHYRAYSSVITEAGSDIYDSINTLEQYNEFISKMKVHKLSDEEFDFRPEEQAPLLCLSTCHGKAGGTEKLVITAVASMG